MSGKKQNKNYYTLKNKVELIKGGHQYFSLLKELIDSAAHSIHLQTYIFDDDETGLMVAAAMIKAAQRNVQIYFIADGYASRGLSRSFITNLTNAGIHFKYFEPLFKSQHFYFGRRMHHKVFVVDGKHAIVGGVNITNRYNDMPAKPAWLDFALYVQGEAAIQLFEFCNASWRSKITVPQLPNDIEVFLNNIPEKEYCSVRIRRNDWVKNKIEIWRSYLELFNHANHSIVIMCSYFLPGWELLKRLKKATKRGVIIKIILTGVSDVMIAKYAERYLYYWMLKNNIQLFEYQPNVLHAKLAIADEHWVTVGSYNINNISARASTEINLDVRNKLFAQKTQMQIEEIIERECIRVTSENYINNRFF
jgi:cardiolipin synthase